MNYDNVRIKVNDTYLPPPVSIDYSLEDMDADSERDTRNAILDRNRIRSDIFKISLTYGIDDTETGVVVITGYISGGVIFSALVSYGTKYSVKLISFNSSNAIPNEATIDGVNKKIQFTVNTTIQATIIWIIILYLFGIGVSLLVISSNNPSNIIKNDDINIDNIKLSFGAKSI